jgi:outer membrane protein insertion porin family
MKCLTALVILSLVYFTLAKEMTWYVEGIVFQGNGDVKSSELIPLMKLQPPEFFTRTEYSFSKLVDDISVIERYYYRKGYLSASVQIAGIEKDTAIQGVAIRLRINEGVQTVVNCIAFTGDTIFTDSALSAFIPLKENAPLDSVVYEQSGRIIKDSLAIRGFVFASVDRSIEINKERDSATIIYKIEAGPVVLRGDLEIVGAEAVKRKVIEREVSLEKGEVLTAYEIARSIRRLYGTGLFDYVLFEPQDTSSVSSGEDTVTVPVLIQLQAADMYSLQLGGGYNTEDGFYGTAEASYANLFSLGHRISASTRLSFELSSAQLVYSYPWVFGVPLFSDLSAFIERQEEIDFTGLFTGGLLSLNSRLDMRSWYRTWIQIENTLWLHDLASGLDTSIDSRGNFVLLGAGYTRDQRNNLMNPGKGFFGFVEGEIAGPWILWSDKFYRFKGDIRGYYPFLNEKVTVASALFAGYVMEYGVDRNVPPQELFRVGEDGVRPVRGYTDEEVVFPNDNAGGGKFALIVTPLEVTFPIYRILEGAVFVDCGVIWQSPVGIDLNDLRWSIGPGLRLVNLPIGLVRLDYGLPVKKNLNLKGRIHFGIGATF